MTVQQRPVHRPGSPESAYDESQYAAFAAAQFRILKDYMALAKLNTYSRVVTLANGVVITCQKSFNREDIFITTLAPFTDEIVREEMVPIFASIPRILDVNDGYTSNYNATGDGSVVYQLDNAETSQLLVRAEQTGDESGIESGLKPLRNNMVYGNVDWKGGSGAILTWKGVASRYFEFNQYAFVNGYTSFDEEITQVINGVPTPVNVYTVFSPDIYSEGEVTAAIPNGDANIFVDGVQQFSGAGPVKTLPGATPPKVLGCAYNSGNLIAVVSMNYRGMENPGGGAGGFFNEVYAHIEGEWARIAFNVGSRPTVNWFFNSSGTQASTIHAGALWTVDITKIGDSFSAIFSSDSTLCAGTITKSKPATSEATGTIGVDWQNYVNYSLDLQRIVHNTGSVKTTRSETCKVAVDYKGDERVFATAVRDDTEEETTDATDTTNYFLLQNIPNVAPDILAGVGMDNEYAYVGTHILAYGGMGPFTYDFSGGTVDTAGRISSLSSIPCTSGAPATATITVTDQCTGVSKSGIVKVPYTTASWVQVGHVFNPGWDGSLDPDTACGSCGIMVCSDIISGNTRMVKTGYGFNDVPNAPPCKALSPLACEGGYCKVYILQWTDTYQWRCP